MSKPKKEDLVQLIRIQLVNCDGMNDEEYLAWKEIMRIVKDSAYE